MAMTTNAIAGSAIAAVGLILVGIAMPVRWVAQPAVAANAAPVASTPSVVTGGGVTLQSVAVSFPRSEGIFPGGDDADAMNGNCLICHSTGMVLTQPGLTRSAWQGIVVQMQHDFHAPFATADETAIVDYLVNLNALAQSPSGRQPDPSHGAVIAAQGTASGAPACALCHAFNGASDGSGAFPRVAGQPAYYLAQQLRDFASGVRTSAIMTPVAKALSPDDISDVTAYFAGVDAPFLPLAAPDPELVKRGAQLAMAGGPDKLHCNNCHGPDGSGAPPAIPYLGGQYAQYITFTLQMWQQGFRKNSPDPMAVIAQTLSDQDISAVAAYYQQANAPLGMAAK
ncbi:MAG: c-type cytochrome [Devosia sp.]|uniref:c-type cytochrome n=1 Tax=Devosia sp. TaxID=1871048 RepID=UPI00262AC76D|nr:c-type cytochrome [Devosia sp.]MDB5542264.1 c-type cytochrome [Devosia sp.]